MTTFPELLEPNFDIDSYLRAIDPVLDEMIIENIRLLVKTIEAEIARKTN